MIHSGLPVDALIPEILASLQKKDSLLLSADPGAGKSTVVPIALLQSGLTGGKNIIMLEPRVLAARAAAKRMAHLLGEKPGETVGYRTRLETCRSAGTRIEVVTEAILTKMLQNDPTLEQTGLIIFDEFHERSIHADLALALTLDARAAFRDDLKLVVMSATLDHGTLKPLLNDPAEVHAEGKCYPVRVIYSAEHEMLPLEQRVRHAVNSALASFSGDALVFLPGEYEIRAVYRLLKDDAATDREVLCLYGSMTAEEQDKVFLSHGESVRRVILATSIAETSITIPGIGIVIDSGLSRVPKFSPSAGMDRLETIPVTKAGAEQRRGRAGRTGPGVCIRLWNEFKQDALADYPQPEIMSADLAPMMLELAKWGRTKENVSALPWVTCPPVPMIAQACELLCGLDAIQANGKLSPHGEKLRSFPLHPRVAHAVLLGAKLGFPDLAAELGAILEDHELSQTDVRDRLSALNRHEPSTGLIRHNADRIRTLLRREGDRADVSLDILAGLLISAAYPDRIARTKEKASGEYSLANGIAAVLRKEDPLSHSEYLACAETSTARGRTVIRLAAPITPDDLERFLPHIFQTKETLVWDNERSMTVWEKLVSIGSITVKRTRISGKPPDELLIPAMLQAIRDAGYRLAFAPSPSAESFRERVIFLHHLGTEGFPDFSEEALMNTLEEWLVPHLSGIHSFSGLQALNLRGILEQQISRQLLFKMNSLAPEKVEVPSGSNIRISYADPAQPTASVRLQELFGMVSTPKLAGRVPILLDILSPAMRTVQKTRDLKSFWKESYFLVRKDMRGRYPKHDWPEDPLHAIPHRGVRKPS